MTGKVSKAEMRRLSKQLTSGSFEGLAAGAPSDASPKAKTAEEVLDRPSEPEISLKRLSSSMSGGLNLNLSRRRSSLQIGSGRKSKDASVPVAKELDSPSPNKEVVSATAGSSAPTTPVAIPNKIKRPSRSRSSLLPDTGLGSSPTSSESSSSSSLELKMKRRSSGSASRRRASETSPQINSLKPKRGSQRLSDSELRINSFPTVETDAADAEWADHLSQLKAAAPSRDRSGSLARVKDAARNMDLDRLPTSSTTSSQGASPGGSSVSTPTLSPMGSPRTKSKTRTVTKAVDYLDGGDLDGFQKTLLDSRLGLVGALFDVSPESQWSELAEKLVAIFEKNHKSMRLIIWALRKEVASTPHEHDMFRLDSAASKLMGAYGQLIAGSWLRDLLKPTVKKVNSIVAKSEKDKEEVPVQRIWKVLDSMLQLLVSNVGSVPFPLRVLCFYIKDEVEKRFPGRANFGIGAFVFLRLICPAIVAPEARAICKNEPTLPQRKLLVRVARELQQLVNVANRGVSLSSEMYGDTTEQVTFVGLNLERIKTFLDSVGTKTLEEIDQSESSKFLSPMKKSGTFSSADMKAGDSAMEWIVSFVKENKKALTK